MEGKNVLFISHDATRSGAPIFLLRLLKWFQMNSDLSFQILLKDGGELVSEFSELAPTYIFHDASAGRYLNIARLNLTPIRRRLESLHHTYLLNRLKKAEIGLAYSNTITNGHLLEYLSPLGCPVITHVHELEHTINSYGDHNFDLTRKYTARYIAVSGMVRDNLVNNHSLDHRNIEMIPGFISPDNRAEKGLEEARAHIRSEMNIPDGSFLVGACGGFHWVKSPELFVQVAGRVYKKKPSAPIHYIWVGGDTSGIRYNELMYDARTLGIEHRVHFVGHRNNTMEYYPAFDVFVLVSREDSFPLVCLEAASAGNPLICFDQVSGIREFIEDDCGFVVPYLDIESMADRIIETMERPELRTRMGECAARKVREKFTVDVHAPGLLRMIKQYI